MVGLLAFLVFAGALSSSELFAQTSWCSYAVRIEAPLITYPPIARAAHVSGVVIGKLILSDEGVVQDFVTLSGPAMLVDRVSKEVKNWKFKQQQSAEHSCQALLIVGFTLDRDNNPDPTPAPSNGIKIWINASAPAINTISTDY